MKIFYDKINRKINFVDDYNVFVGFSDERKCCEDFGWYISKSEKFDWSEMEKSIDEDDILKEYKFDRSYFHRECFESVGDEDDPEVITFRLFKSQYGDFIYLHLYNSHNGYYTHNFTFRENDGHRIFIEGAI